MALYLIFRVYFHISMNQFVSKLVVLSIWIFIPDITFFSVLSNICFECVVTLCMVTDKRNFFQIHLERISQDVILKDSIAKSLD